jgi:phospholipid/cholesterol/gamma-HCH transport system ATP-binding protein
MVAVEGLNKSFGEKDVLRDIDLMVEQGQILAIMGSSGGGKTTLLRCISGLIEPTSGSISVAGVDVRTDAERARERMGMVFQSAALFDYLNVRENVLFGIRRRRQHTPAEMDALVSELLDTVGLKGSENLMPAELSGGMKKRVGVARALALRPDVMLYDEPITGLDPVTAYLIDRLILRVRDTYHVTSIVVSHDVSSVVRVADQVAFLDQGELAFVGSPEQFVESTYPAIEDLVSKSQAREIKVEPETD